MFSAFGALRNFFRELYTREETIKEPEVCHGNVRIEILRPGSPADNGTDIYIPEFRLGHNPVMSCLYHELHGKVNRKKGILVRPPKDYYLGQGEFIDIRKDGDTYVVRAGAVSNVYNYRRSA